jgi:hypothetical protein
MLLAFGIAAVAAMLVAVFGGAVIARDLLLQRLARDLPRDEQAYRVDLVGFPALTRRLRPDDVAQRALAELTNERPSRIVAFRDFWLDGQFIRLGAIDEPHGHVRVVTGRMPRRCGPTVCEVLQLGRAGKARLDEGDIHLRRVGVGVLHDPQTFGSAFTGLRRQRAQASYPTSIVLLGPRSAALERLPSLELLFRLASWVVPMEPADLHDWQVEDLLRRESLAQATLDHSDPLFILSGPDSALTEAKARRDAYGARLALIGGSVAVALFGFALVAAAGLRRGIAGERRRLAQRGATRSQQVVAALTEVGVIGVLGWLIGTVAGALAIALIAWRQGLPSAAVVGRALLTPDAALVLTFGLVLAVVVLLVVVSGEDRVEGRARVRPVDIVLAGVVLAAVAGVSRGALHADTLDGGDRTFLLLLPALICVAGGLAAARLLGPVMTLGERLARGGSVPLRLALLALARSPARTAAVGAFLVVTVALLVFAASYRATLEQGARDAAAFAVPFDVTVTSGTSLAGPLDIATPAHYEKLAGGTRAYPVLRRTAIARGAGTSAQSPTVLGLPHDAFSRLPWRSDYAALARSTLAERVEPTKDVALRGVRLPTGTAGLRVEASLSGEPLAVVLVARDRRGHFLRLPLGALTPGRTTLTARVPSGAVEIVSLELDLTKTARAWYFHLDNEGRLLRAPSGVLRLGPLTATGAGGEKRVTDWGGWITRGRTATVLGGIGRALVSYAFEEAESLHLRPRQATDGIVLPVVVSPMIAAAADADGLVQLDFLSTRVTGRVAAVARRFPSIGEGEEFVVADADALETSLDADAPGAGTPGEVWLAAPPHGAGTLERELARSPFSRLERLTQEALYKDAHDDPLALGVSNVLGAAALVALLLAVAGLWLMVLSDLRDERDTFFDLEAQGAGPRTLRTQVRIRALLLLAFGVIGGTVLGFVLSRLAVSLVQVTGAATKPFPPLVLDADLAVVALALVLLVTASLVVVELTVRRAFHASAPERALWSLE